MRSRCDCAAQSDLSRAKICRSIGALDSAPGDFDASTHPIIARHFFGVEPFRPVGEVAAEVVAELRFRRQVQRLYRLGPRAVGELLAELGAERGIQTIIGLKLECYARLDREALEVASGNRFWPVPLHEVRREP